MESNHPQWEQKKKRLSTMKKVVDAVFGITGFGILFGGLLIDWKYMVSDMMQDARIISDTRRALDVAVLSGLALLGMLSYYGVGLLERRKKLIVDQELTGVCAGRRELSAEDRLLQLSYVLLLLGASCMIVYTYLSITCFNYVLSILLMTATLFCFLKAPVYRWPAGAVIPLIINIVTGATPPEWYVLYGAGILLYAAGLLLYNIIKKRSTACFPQKAEEAIRPLLEQIMTVEQFEPGFFENNKAFSADHPRGCLFTKGVFRGKPVTFSNVRFSSGVVIDTDLPSQAGAGTPIDGVFITYTLDGFLSDDMLVMIRTYLQPYHLYMASRTSVDCAAVLLNDGSFFIRDDYRTPKSRDLLAIDEKKLADILAAIDKAVNSRLAYGRGESVYPMTAADQ